jgi:hypothetical protein
MAEHCLVQVGADPGTTNFGIGGLRFTGYVDIVDEEGGEKTIPLVELISMERWNLKTGEIVRPKDNFASYEKVNIMPTGYGSQDQNKCLAAVMGEAVARTAWLFQRFPSSLHKGAATLPGLLVEQQMDGRPNSGKDPMMQRISFQIMSAVSAVDASNKDTRDGPVRREFCHGMKKYGQKSDGSRERLERKAKSVADLKLLLAELSQLEEKHPKIAKHARVCLKWMEMLERDGEQIHDMTDGINSAIARCGTLVEMNNKSKIAELRQQIKKIPNGVIQPAKKTGKAKEKKVAEPKPKKAKPARAAEQKAVNKAFKEDSYPILIDVSELDDTGKKISTQSRKRKLPDENEGSKKKAKKV